MRETRALNVGSNDRETTWDLNRLGVKLTVTSWVASRDRSGGGIVSISARSDMGESSLLSSSNYFDRMRYKAREIDEGINKLTQIWKTPHLLIGGYAERTDEMTAYLEELWNSTQSTDVSTQLFCTRREMSRGFPHERNKSMRYMYYLRHYPVIIK